MPARPLRWRSHGFAARRPGKRPKSQQRSEIYGEFLAIDTAMDRLQAGELCLVLVDQVPQAMAHIAAKVEKSLQQG